MIFIPIVIIILILFFRIQKGMFAALLILVGVKSLLDAFWNIRIGPLSFASFGGVLIPVIFFPVLKHRKKFPKLVRDNAKILLIAMSLGLLFALPLEPIRTLELFVINFNIYLSFFLIPALVDSHKKLKLFLTALMIGGVFPILVSLFQFRTGIIFYERETVGITRYVGFYHDAFTVRFYGFMTLFSCLLYLSIFKVRKKMITVLVYTLMLGAFFSIYLVFSKAAVGLIGLWSVLLLLFSKSRVKQLFAMAIGISIVFVVFGDVFFDNIEQMFSKEIGYQEGKVTDSRYTLAGRGYVWEDHWNFWANEQPLFFQWFGDGISRPTHNEFLRVVMVSGIIGLLVLIVYIFRSVRMVFKINKFLRVYAFMLLGMYFVDCLGLVPGVYYYYNILLWGMIVLFLFTDIKQKITV